MRLAAIFIFCVLVTSLTVGQISGALKQRARRTKSSVSAINDAIREEMAQIAARHR